MGACVGKGAVLRISFGTFLFFAVHFVALLGALDVAPSIRCCGWENDRMYCRCYLDVFQASAAVRHCRSLQPSITSKQARMSSRLCTTHAAPAGVTKNSNKRRLVHTGCWPLQLTLWLLLIVACFFMPNSIYRCCLLV